MPRTDPHASRILDMLRKRGGKLLSMLTLDQLRELSNKSKVHTVAERGILIKQGDRSDCMYIVLKGGMRVVRCYYLPLNVPQSTSPCLLVAVRKNAFFATAQGTCCLNTDDTS